MLPNGYWTFPVNMPRVEVSRFGEFLNSRIASGLPVLVSHGVEFHPFPQPAPPMVTPDAFCKYCGSANLRVSFECLKCGAPLVH